MLEKNLQALESKNSMLVNTLKAYQSKNIEVYQSESGDINIAYKNTLLHNQSDPMKEAENICKSQNITNNRNSFTIVYGLGLGYLFKRTYISTNGRIILFEPHLDILKFTLNYVDFSNELSDQRVSICTTIDEVLDVLKNKFIVGDTIEVACLNSYATLTKTLLEEFSKQIVSFIESKKQDQGTIISRSLHWGRTSMINLEHIKQSLPVDILEKKYSDRPIIIVSAGPSLEENIDLLKKHRNKFILLTINTALKALLDNEIIPDFCVIAEVAFIDSQFKGLKHLNKLHYILHPRAQQNYPWKLSDNTNFVYLSEVDGFSCWYNELLDNKYKLWPSAGTVSLLAFYIATKVFQSKNIILVGQDLAFVNNQVYSPSSIQENEEYLLENESIKVKSSIKEKAQIISNIKTIKIKNSLGQEVLTRKDYYEYISFYEDIIKNELPNNINIINTSLKGAFIKGMTYSNLEKVLKQFQICDKSIYDSTNEILKNNNGSIDENIKLINPQIINFINEIGIKLSECKKIIEIINQFKSTYSKNTSNPKLPSLLQNFYTKKEPIINFINNNKLLFFMMQKPYITYAQNYIMPKKNMTLNINQHALNLENEYTLFKEIIIVLEWFIETKDKHLNNI